MVLWTCILRSLKGGMANIAQSSKYWWILNGLVNLSEHQFWKRDQKKIEVVDIEHALHMHVSISVPICICTYTWFSCQNMGIYIMHYTYIYIIRFIWFIWKSDWECGAVHSQVPQICYNSQGWAVLKPGSRNSIWFSHMGGRGPRIWAIIWCLLKLITGKLEQPRWEPALQYGMLTLQVVA